MGGFSQFFSNVFKKRAPSTRKTSKKAKSASKSTLVFQINKSVDQLLQKADSLNESWENERIILREIAEEVKKFVPEDDILSAKFEQDILGKITACSSACDGVIAGRQGTDFIPLLQSLQACVKQRAAMAV